MKVNCPKFVVLVFYFWLLTFSFSSLQNCNPESNICCTYRPPATTPTTRRTTTTTTSVPFATCPRDSDCVAPQDCRNGEISAINYVKKQGVSCDRQLLGLRRLISSTCATHTHWHRHTYTHADRVENNHGNCLGVSANLAVGKPLEKPTTAASNRILMCQCDEAMPRKQSVPQAHTYTHIQMRCCSNPQRISQAMQLQMENNKNSNYASSSSNSIYSAQPMRLISTQLVYISRRNILVLLLLLLLLLVCNCN